MKFLRRLAVFLVVLLCVLTVTAMWLLRYQGNANVAWNKISWGKVRFDSNGIPTIESSNWLDLVRLQGYVHASDRMWQMDLIRRSASGRLSEFFGEKALNFDRNRTLEDWAGAALRSYEKLPEKEKQFCDAYAEGVNRFIKENRHHWGLEYLLLQKGPVEWRCTDSLLVLLSMADLLTASAEIELKQTLWREKLSEEWQNFLFPKTHPWAKPLFGAPNVRSAALPPNWQYIPRKELKDPMESENSEFKDPVLKGSNAWTVHNKDQVLLAADPHLGQSVPQVWYANRLRVDDNSWVVGASLPGLPGVVIGMNKHLAWSFTNLGEDVDDYLKESITPDGQQYLAYEENGRQNWRRLVTKRAIIKVKGREDEVVEVRYTHRGPLRSMDVKGEKIFVSRQWIGFEPEFLRLPMIQADQSTSWAEFNAAMDAMTLPCQAAVYADRLGNIGYRTTGIGIKRQASGIVLQNALEGEWKGFEPLSERKRLFYAAGGKEPRKFIAAANAQIWNDTYGQRWMSDDRRERIDRALTDANFDRSSMEALQLDTQSRFAKEFLNWIANNAQQKAKGLDKVFERWRKWNGDGTGDEQSFTEADFLEKEMVNILIGRVKEHFFSDVKDLPDYESFLRRAWILRIISTPNSTAAFGLQDKELAVFLTDRLKRKLMQAGSEKLVAYSQANSWAAQHPFADNVPYIGWLFKVKSFSQHGGSFLVRAERPKFGPSMRMVWNLQSPKDSSWLFPVGQSGHVGSAYYRDMQDMWITSGKRLNPFPDSENWKF